MNKNIYQIGFNKTATVALHRYFEKNGIKSVHYDDGKLSKTVCGNYRLGKPLFSGYEGYQAFTDIEHFDRNGESVYTAEKLFREFYQQDPGALFVLNVRPLDAWLSSRKRFGNYLLRTSIAKRLTRGQVEEFWTEEYLSHVNAVTDFFKDKGHLLFFDISKEDGAYLTSFFNQHGFSFEEKHWTKRHVSSEADKEKLALSLAEKIRIQNKKLRFATRMFRKSFKKKRVHF